MASTMTPAFRALLRSVEGFDAVGEASTGAEAFAVVRGCRPDIVLMDLNTYTWSTNTPKPRLLTMTNIATGRLIKLRWGPADDPLDPAHSCTATPAATLCLVTYWDTTVTKMTYSASQLARIEDPGDPSGAAATPKTDFAYANGAAGLGALAPGRRRGGLGWSQRRAGGAHRDRL